MKKKTILIGSALILGTGIYIGNQSARPNSYERDEIVMRAKNLIRRINRRDYETCLGLFDDALLESMDIEKLQNIFEPTLEILGEFQRFRNAIVSRSDMSSKKEKDSDAMESLHGREPSDYVSCIVNCEYKNGPATFNILFDRSRKVCGIYIE